MKGHTAWNKGLHKRTNTGRTHFKKGMTPWIKGKHIRVNDALIKWRENGGKPWTTGLKGIMSGKRNGMWKGGKPRCSICNILLSCYSAKKCSKHRGVKGAKNNKWKGGITPLNKLERAKFNQSIRKQVFERDNYTCQICGIRGIVLQVDHIQSWVEYVELRFSMDNCRTVCQPCHYKITFGKPMPKSVKTWGHNFKYSGRKVDLK